MQELRFVGVEDGAVIATNEDGERFRLVVDEGLREALRPRPAARTAGPKVAPRLIQQLIRAGSTVDDVVERTGADPELVARFEGPILAERGYIVEQARAVPVRVAQPLDPLAGEGATFGGAIDDRLEQLEASGVRWDAWRDPETGWHIGLDFVADDVTRNALWKFDARTRTLEAVSPAAITLSQQGELPPLGGPHLRAVETFSTDSVIPVAAPPRRDDPFAAAESGRATTHETENLLEQLRRRRGERSASSYDDEAELVGGLDEDFDEPLRFDDEHAADDEHAPAAAVTPFPGRAEAPPAEPAAAHDEDGTVHDEARDGIADASAESSADEPADAVAPHEGADAESGSPAPVRAVDVPLEGMETPETPEPRGARRRGGRPSMPSWDEIVFGTRTDDD